jgi:hypothetical protein
MAGVSNLTRFLEALAAKAKARPQKDRYRVVKGHRDSVRNLDATQVKALEAEGYKVTPVEDSKMVDNFEEIRKRGLRSTTTGMPSMGAVRDTLDRGPSMRAPTKVGQSAHFRQWMNDARFKKVIKDVK